MSKKTLVLLQCDVRCQTQGPAPVYRAWLDDELFTERTWRLDPHQYLQEQWQITARPGRYQIRYELIGTGEILISNWQVLHGPAGVTEEGRLVIHDA